MDGKLVLVTGATSGIGKEAARELARMGARLVIVGRNKEKTEAAAQELRAGEPVDVLLADFSSLDDVRRLAAEIKQRYPRIDVLVSNAGLIRLRRGVSRDGFEETFAVNHLAPFLLVNSLLDHLKKSAPARIVIVGSDAHRGKSLDFDDLQSERGYRMMDVYGRSKLANIMFTYALSRRIAGTGLTANVLHPGFVATNLGSGNWIPVKPFMFVLRFFVLSPAQGAEPIVHLASSPDVEGVNGAYYDRLKAARSSRVTYDEDVQERLWSVSAKMTGLS